MIAQIFTKETKVNIDNIDFLKYENIKNDLNNLFDYKVVLDGTDKIIEALKNKNYKETFCAITQKECISLTIKGKTTTFYKTKKKNSLFLSENNELLPEEYKDKVKKNNRLYKKFIKNIKEKHNIVDYIPKKENVLLGDYSDDNIKYILTSEPPEESESSEKIYISYEQLGLTKKVLDVLDKIIT